MRSWTAPVCQWSDFSKWIDDSRLLCFLPDKVNELRGISKVLKGRTITFTPLGDLHGCEVMYLPFQRRYCSTDIYMWLYCAIFVIAFHLFIVAFHLYFLSVDTSRPSEDVRSTVSFRFRTPFFQEEFSKFDVHGNSST